MLIDWIVKCPDDVCCLFLPVWIGFSYFQHGGNWILESGQLEIPGMDVRLCEIGHDKSCFALTNVGIPQHHSPHEPEGVVRAQVVVDYHWFVGLFKQLDYLLLVFVLHQKLLRYLSMLGIDSLFYMVFGKEVAQDASKQRNACESPSWVDLDFPRCVYKFEK